MAKVELSLLKKNSDGRGAVIQRRWFRDMLHNVSVDRLGTSGEIGALVAFVASPRADYVNGANLRADGGKSPSIN